MFLQLSLFDEAQLRAGAVARNLFSGEEVETEDVPDWALRLVPEAVALIHVGSHPCALQRKKITPEQVPVGMEYCHYQIGREVYGGTFVEKG